jgi:hypothetical protein
MSSEQTSAVVHAMLAIAPVVVSVAVGVVVAMLASGAAIRHARMEYDRASREWWRTVEQLALSHDALLRVAQRMADNVMNPRAPEHDVEQGQYRWCPPSSLRCPRRARRARSRQERSAPTGRTT